LILILLLVALYQCQTSPIFIIPQYGTKITYTYEALEAKNYTINLCNPVPIQFCTINVSYSLPYTQVNFNTAIYIQFLVYVSGDGCNGFICKNSFNENMQWCSFDYNVNMEDHIYIQTFAGNSPDMSSVTWNAMITCPSSEEIEKRKNMKLKENFEKIIDFPDLCDHTSENLQQFYVMNLAGSTPTTENFTLNDKYYFNFCDDGINSATTFTTYVSATNIDSAFKTYICGSAVSVGTPPTCPPNNSPIGFNKDDPSGLNQITVTTATPNDVIAMTVQGSGSLNANNNYLLTIFHN